MVYLAAKALLSGVIIAIVSEVAKRSPGIGALITSLPLISVLAMIWLWRDTSDVVRIASYAEATFWLVLPTLPMFLCCRFYCAKVPVSGWRWPHPASHRGIVSRCSEAFCRILELKSRA